MTFNSLAFGIFLPIVFLIYWAIPHKCRWTALLIASYYFYMSWNAKYVILIMLTTIVAYLCGLALERTQHKVKRRMILVATLAVSLGVLFFFKYFNFFSNSLIQVLGMFSISLQPITLKLMLPVGISFYTFQTLSYVIDVYKGDVRAEHHLGKFALFVSFFPQLVAGPIERSGNLLSQFDEKHTFNYDQTIYGLKLMTWGFFKKMVIADNVSVCVDSVFGNVRNCQGLSLIIATILFSFQTYCDFSGYSDIAIGTARMFGFRLMTNFKSPYFSKSVTEFWTRWHISLSTWFRDYIYFPLGGSHCKKIRSYFNTLVTFLISGLWHGAAWTYVIWGGMYGAIQVLEKMTGISKREPKTGWGKAIRILFTFILISVCAVMFRSQSVSDALYTYRNMFVFTGEFGQMIRTTFYQLGVSKAVLAQIGISLVILTVYDYISLKQDVIGVVSRMKKVKRRLIYYALITLILCFRASGEAEFVYFQF